MVINKRKIIIISCIILLLTTALTLGLVLPKQLASRVHIDIDLSKLDMQSFANQISVQSSSVAEEIDYQDSIAYNYKEKKSIFSDDILLSFIVKNNQNIKMEIITTFYFEDWSGGSKGAYWATEGASGEKLIISSKQKVRAIDIKIKLFYNDNTFDYIHTLTKSI